MSVFCAHKRGFKLFYVATHALGHATNYKLIDKQGERCNAHITYTKLKVRSGQHTSMRLRGRSIHQCHACPVSHAVPMPMLSFPCRAHAHTQAAQLGLVSTAPQNFSWGMRTPQQKPLCPHPENQARRQLPNLATSFSPRCQVPVIYGPCLPTCPHP